MNIRNIIFGILIIALIYNIIYGKNVLEHHPKSKCPKIKCPKSKCPKIKCPKLSKNICNNIFNEQDEYSIDWLNNETIEGIKFEIPTSIQDENLTKHNSYFKKKTKFSNIYKIYYVQDEKKMYLCIDRFGQYQKAKFKELTSDKKENEYLWRILPIYDDKYVILSEDLWYVLLYEHPENNDVYKTLDTERWFINSTKVGYKDNKQLFTIKKLS